MGKSADKGEKRRTVSGLLLKKQQEVFAWAEKGKSKSAARGAQARQGEGVPGRPPRSIAWTFSDLLAVKEDTP